MTSPHFGKWLTNPSTGEEVVLSGISGRFPDCENVYEFREKLFNKRYMVTDDDRTWKINHPEIPPRQGKIYNIDRFDAGYFGVHYRQADNMDPMIRKFLETAIEAVMDAGINPSELEGSRTGVFVGACYSDMECETLQNITDLQTFVVTGYLRSFIPNRISYHLKLKGPSIIVDTACSSSMNALEIGFKAIRSGQCDNALIGGVNLLMHAGITLQFSRLGVLNMDGVCKVFDQKADGYSRSETIACILLQKARNAKRIYSQVLYTKVNCDGFKLEGITFPSTQMQRQLMTDIFEDSGITASDISFLEAHGTGTAVGDPQELEAIDDAIAKKRLKPLLIGSVKCSIGHTEPASGLCSLIKVITAMETGLIAPNINLSKIREDVRGFQEGRLKVVTKLTELEGENAIVGINNFGFGGNNCHMLVRRFQKKKTKNGNLQDDIPKLICVSGRTEDSVIHFIDNLKQIPFDHEHIGLIHQLFKYNIPQHLYRGYIIVSNQNTVNTSIKFVETQLQLYIYFGQLNSCFSVLGRYLLNFPIFKMSLDRVNNLLKTTNMNIFNMILDNTVKSNSTLLAILSVQIGIVDILKHLEIKPKAVYYGDWMGKLITAYYYGRITLEEIVFIISQNIFKTSIIDLKLENIISNLNSPKKCNSKDNGHGVKLENNNVRLFSKNSVILNISDKRLSKTDLLLTEEKTVNFLETLGRLYQAGFNPQIHKLYPPIEYPVSRNTPMIAPLIKWNHEKQWYTYEFKSFENAEIRQREVNIGYLHQEWKYNIGHVIDERNFIPATEYLNLVWQLFAQGQALMINDTSVIFENCKFVRAVTIPKSDFVKILISLQLGSGNFEILEKNSLVVSGRIRSFTEDSPSTNLPSTTLDGTDKALVLEQDDIYRELYLRGYNYSGLFKGIVKCNITASTGLIKWEDNWTTFMDKMLQMKILQADTRLLYVPVGIKRLKIDPAKHLSLIDKTTNLVPVNVCAENDVINSGGIEISGLLARSIFRKKPPLEPILEKHEFIPNRAQLNIAEAITVNIQIILENVMENNFTAVELIDNFTETKSEILLPIVYQVLEAIPLVKPDLIISTKHALHYNISHIKVEDYLLTSNSNLVLIVGSKILQRANLSSILSALGKNGFALTREDTNLNLENVNNIKIITEYSIENEKLVLFRRNDPLEDVKCIEVSSQTFNWLSQLQDALKFKSEIILYSQNQELCGILGLTNCIRREPGGSKVRCFFMMDRAPAFDLTNPFYQNQVNKNLAVNIYKNSQWGTYRHLRLKELKEVEGEHFYVNTIGIGDLSSLSWIKGPLTPRTPLKENKTLIYNYYASINFKDIMLASGRITADVVTKDRLEQESLLGFEFSGRDASGRRVVGLTTNSALSTLFVIGNLDFLWNVPDNWTLEQAATFPAVYSTALYALRKVILITPGMSVLIHSATGGVGLAAINICLYYKCIIFITVGTNEKREYIKKQFPQIPESHIGNSRDTSFEQMIKTETNGRGVDAVLNSLSEEKLVASIRCLAKGGHLLEIGKFDLANDTSLNMLLLKREISYHGISLDRILVQSHRLRKWLLNQIYEGLRLGFIKPLPITVFQPNEIEKAFRYMTSGKHIGKIVIRLRDEEKELVTQPSKAHFTGISRFNCGLENCYIIIGGLGGFGMELADWLVLRGARNLVLVSTSGVKTGYQTQRIRIWQSYGVQVQVSMRDVTTKQGCIQLLEESSKYGPIDGIFNLAVVLKDALFQDQTEEKFHISLSPKATATKYLDEVTRERYPNLKYFVVFSSVSCGRGNVGQTNYGMANSVMERICERRKLDGFSALAIQWGAIGEVGLVAKMQKENRELIIGGTLQQKVSSCLKALDTFLNQENPIVSSMIVAEKHTKLTASSAVEAIAYVLGIKDLKNLNQNATLAELGMDSMVGTEIIQILEKDFDIYVSAKEVRSLSFARISELEAEKANGVQETKNISKDLILQYIPDERTGKMPVIKLPSRIEDESAAAKVFVICGIEGIFKPLELITRNLNAHVFGLQDIYDNPKDTIEDTARFMLPHVEEHITKDNKFYILAYSYGVVVALELAVLLENKGYNGSVVLIDGSPTYLTTAVKKHFVCETEKEFESLLLIKLLSLVLPADAVSQKKDELLNCANFNDRIELGLTMVPKHFTDIKLERQGAIVLYKRLKAITNYTFCHKKINASVHLFKAKCPMVADMAEDFDLSLHCEKPVKVTELEGDHMTILKQINIAEEVNKLLD